MNNCLSFQIIKRRIKYFKKAYELGSTRAAVNLGYCYKCGLGVEPDKNIHRSF